MWEELLGKDLAAFYADLPLQEEKEELVATLDDESTSQVDEELAAMLADASAPEQDDEIVAAHTVEPAPKKATFDPSTRMHAGKVKWEERFTSLPHALLVHETFAELSGRAVKLLLAIASQYMGSNNGHLTATASRMQAFGFHSKDSLAKSIQELLVFGFMVRTRSQQKRLPALYAVTWFPIHEAPKGKPYNPGITPTDESSDLWRHTDPAKAKGELRARQAAALTRKLGLDGDEVAPA